MAQQPAAPADAAVTLTAAPLQKLRSMDAFVRTMLLDAADGKDEREEGREGRALGGARGRGGGAGRGAARGGPAPPGFAHR